SAGKRKRARNQTPRLSETARTALRAAAGKEHRRVGAVGQHADRHVGVADLTTSVRAALYETTNLKQTVYLPAFEQYFIVMEPGSGRLYETLSPSAKKWCSTGTFV